MVSIDSTNAESLTIPVGDNRSVSTGSGLWWKRVVIVLAVCGAAAFFSMLLWDTSSGTPETMLTHTIQREDLVVKVTEQGTLESSNNTEIKCKVRGFSTVTWVVDVGTDVNEGDELVRLDVKTIEEFVSLQKTNVHTARATLARTTADVAKAEISVEAYEEGLYKSQLKRLEQSQIIAEKRLKTAKKILERTERLYSLGYVNAFELEADCFSVTQKELELEVNKKQINVLKKYTRGMQLASLNGDVTASQSKLEADKAGLEMDEIRLARAEEELKDCVISAPRGGLVIYPSSAEWKETPDITEGATVRKDQVLLLMPDLDKMQVKVGIHESIVDRIETGSEAIVSLTEQTLNAKVSSVATVTKPAGWWTGNVVKYDTIIKLPSGKGLKPGMSAKVEIILAHHKDVLTIPVAAVIETENGDFCWIASADGPQRRSIELGDSNEVFIVVKAGLTEGDEVILNPLAFVDDAQNAIQQSFEETSTTD